MTGRVVYLTERSIPNDVLTVGRVCSGGVTLIIGLYPSILHFGTIFKPASEAQGVDMTESFVVNNWATCDYLGYQTSLVL